MTRLLNTPIIGRSAAPVASSCSDMLAGLSKNEILRTPPDFCARAGCATKRRASNGPAVANIPKRGCITPPSRRFQYAPRSSAIASPRVGAKRRPRTSSAKQSRGAEPGRSSLLRRYAPRNDSTCAITLLIEPHVLEAPAVIDAVDHDRQTLDPGLPAGAAGWVKDD